MISTQTVCRVVSCAAMTLLVAAAPPATTSNTPAAQTLHARRVLLIVPEESRQLHDPEFLVELKGHARLLAAEKTGLDEQGLGEWLDVGNYPEGFVIGVNLQPQRRPGDTPLPPVAAEIADELVEWTRQHVVKKHEREQDQAIQRAEHQLRTAKQAQAETEAQLRDLRGNLRELSGRSDVTPQTLTGALSSMDEELQRMELERLAKESRRSALEEGIAAAAARVEKSVQGDAIAAELKKVVETREQAAQTLKKMYESGQASQTELSEAIARVAEARAKMLQQQRDAAAAAGGNALESFNRELMTLSIDSRELETKVKYLNDRLPRLREAVEQLDDYREAERRAREANDQLSEVNRQMARIRAQLESGAFVQPRVLVKERVDFPKSRPQDGH